jgi:hypothetical protein
MLLGGDLNADAGSRGLRALAARGWIEDTTKLHPGVDHLFVRGMQVSSRPAPWPPELRDLYLDGELPVRLSDHDPVDAVVTL